MVRIHLIALGQQLRPVHHRYLPVFYIQIPVAVCILEQENTAVGKQRHVSRLVFQEKCLLVLQLLIADNDILHPGIPAPDAAGFKDARKHSGHPAVYHILINHVFVNNGHGTVDSRLEQLFHGKLLHMPGVILIQLRGGIHILQYIPVEHLTAVPVQILIIGEIQQHLLRQQVAVILRQGVKEILVEPGQVHSLFQGLLIPDKGVLFLAVSLDEQAAHSLQDWQLLVCLVQLLK